MEKINDSKAVIAVKLQNKVLDSHRCNSISETTKDTLMNIMSEDFKKHGHLKGATITEVNMVLINNNLKHYGK